LQGDGNAHVASLAGRAGKLQVEARLGDPVEQEIA